ncbi:MAG: DUF721 domain-containing protein [Spirochaetaceae bacterium]|jgi:predicted nucleic acid-binding Zn ribbon protein|nr:DUF721 domain-containing protein [Spirochaetaceae bacterium]
MRRAGEILSAVMDEYLFKRVQTQKQLSSSWVQIAAHERIAAIVDHSRIVELDLSILLIEADHPAWIQLLQAKQHQVLKSFQDTFPELSITGIAFRLSRPRHAPQALKADPPKEESRPEAVEAVSNVYERLTVKDEDFIESLKRLEKSYRKKAASYSEYKI